MTVSHEPPGIYRATCDQCGDDLVLDLDDATPDAVERELRRVGWHARPVETVRFPTDYGGKRGRKVEYREHDCPDCK